MTDALRDDAPFSAAPQAGDPYLVQTAGLFADLDGDGRPEVLVAPIESRAAPATYRWEGERGAGALVAAHGLGAALRGVPVALLDLDGDGLPDEVGRHGIAAIAWGEGGGFFSEPRPLPIVAPADPIDAYNTGIYVDDLDGDGWLDVVVAMRGCCERAVGPCRDLHLMLRTGPRSYVDRGDLFEAGPPGAGCGVTGATFAGGERLLMAVGSCPDVAAPMFYRASGADRTGRRRFVPFDPTPPDAYYLSRVGNPVPGTKAPLSHAAPMGVAFGDVDGDGLLDMAVTLDAFVALYEGRPSWPLFDRTPHKGYVDVPSDTGHPMVPWGIAFLDLDRDGRQDLVTVYGDDFTWMTDRYAGTQRTTAHWNAGGSRFVDVTEAAKLGRGGQWRSLATGDLDGDGAPDLVVGGQGEPPRVYLNRVDAGNRGLALRLRGTTSNHLGVGARISVDAAGLPRQHFAVYGNQSPYVTSEPLVFVGLGAAERAERVTIRWPSGLVQEVAGVAAGRLHAIVEPETIAVEPRTRHVPSDGSATARVRVTPRNADGSLKRGAAVAVSMTTYPVEHRVTLRMAEGADGAWSAELPLQSGASESVLEATIDGVLMEVRPRVFWDVVRR